MLRGPLSRQRNRVNAAVSAGGIFSFSNVVSFSHRSMFTNEQNLEGLSQRKEKGKTKVEES